LALKVQLVVLGSGFVVVNKVCSVSCLLFLYSQCPPCPAIYKSGGTCPCAPWESAPLGTRPIRKRQPVELLFASEINLCINVVLVLEISRGGGHGTAFFLNDKSIRIRSHILSFLDVFYQMTAVS